MHTPSHPRTPQPHYPHTSAPTPPPLTSGPPTPPEEKKAMCPSESQVHHRPSIRVAGEAGPRQSGTLAASRGRGWCRGPCPLGPDLHARFSPTPQTLRPPGGRWCRTGHGPSIRGRPSRPPSRSPSRPALVGMQRPTAGPLGTREGSWDEWSVVKTFLHDPRGVQPQGWDAG